MKKLIAFTLAVALCFAFTACGKSSDEAALSETSAVTTVAPQTATAPQTTVAPQTATAPQTTVAPQTTAAPVNAVKYNLKQTVSTDIVDFTLENCEFAHYVSNNSANYVEPTEEPNTMFAAKIGTCFVSMTVTITNKDRGGSIDFGGSFSDWNPAEWKVIYNSNTYEMFGFDLNQANYRSINLSYGAIVDKTSGNVISKVGSNNELISAGTSSTIRMFGIIHTDPASIKDGFELEVFVPNSTGEYNSFTYTIPARA